MRRALLILPLLLVALLAWLVLRGGGDTAPDVAGGARPDAAQGEESSPEAVDRKRRSVDETAAQPAAPQGTPFQQQFPEIGQDRPQDPALGAVRGTVLVTRERPATDAVVAVRDGERVLARVHLQGRGAFLLKNVPPGSGYELVARTEGYAPGGMAQLGIVAGETLDVGAVYVGAALDPNVDNRIRVRVTDASGAPLAAARVTASTVYYGALLTLGKMEKQPGGTIVSLTTDAAGEAVFESLPPAAYDVFAEADGFCFEVKQRLTIQRDTRQLVDFRLDPGMTIEGVVVAQDETPVEHARVGGLRFGDFVAVPAVESDAEGRFVLSGLRGGTYFVFSGKEGFGGTEAQNIAAGTKDLRIVMQSGGSVVIRVKDAASGEPIRSFGVRPFRKMPFAYLYAPLIEAQADETGEFRFVFASADYGMEISAPGYALATLPSVTVPSETPVDVALEAQGVVRGRVVSRDDGTPVRGAEVFVKKGGFPPAHVKDLSTVTDADGAFELAGLPPRALSLWVAHVDYTEQIFEGVEPAVSAPGAEPPPAREFLLGSGGRIEGRVLDANSLPVPNTIMQLSAGFDIASARTATTDETGRYVFKNVPPGRAYTVAIGQWSPGRTGQSRSSVAVEDGAVTLVDFVPERSGVDVTGTVTRAGAPVSGVSVSLVSDDGGDSLQQERTDDAGVFTFRAVAPGSYQVVLNRRANVATPLVVAAEGAPAPLAIELPQGGIAGSVVDGATGKAVSGAYVECERLGADGASNLSRLTQAWAGNAISSAEGTFSLSGLADGRYRIRTQREGYGSDVSAAIEVKEGASVEGVRIVLGPAGSVSGLVRNAAGIPLSGASLTVTDADGVSVFLVDLTPSSSDGRYAAERLVPGTYTLTFRKDGYAPASERVTVTAGTPATQDFTLLQGGTLDLNVRTAAGDPAAKAVIKLLDAEGRVVTKSLSLETLFATSADRTDANGHVTVRSIAAGSYRVRVTLAGVASTSEPIEIVEGGTTPFEFTLPAAGGGQ